MSASNWLAESVPAFRNLTKAIAKRNAFAVVTLGGTEEYLLSEARAALLSYLLQGASADFDYYECEADAADGGVIYEQLMALPMFGERRVVLVNDVSAIRKDETKAMLKRYVQKPSPTSSLILVQPMDRKPSRREMTALQDQVNSFWFFELGQSEIAKFVQSFVTENKKTIAGDAVDYLVENSSAQLRDLKAKLEHLVLYAGEAPQITAEMAMRATGVTAEVDMFGFDDAFLEGNSSRVLREARELLDKGMEELALLGRLRTMIGRVWVCGGLAARRAGDAEFQQVLGGQVFKKNDFISGQLSGLARVSCRICS
ncbi:MAG: DNA polymerase III subunit delta [bacterium]|nr:DNA polymerase III subunit delta [bacterium]